jgi:hypothetical protein
MVETTPAKATQAQAIGAAVLHPLDDIVLEAERHHQQHRRGDHGGQGLDLQRLGAGRLAHEHRGQGPAGAGDHPSTMAGRSAAPCGSRLIQATPTKATTRPSDGRGFMVSPSIFQANSAVNGIHSWVATTSGLSDLAMPKAT